MHYNTIKIDSLKVLIPLSDCQIVSPTFMQQWQKLYHGELLDENEPIKFLESSKVSDVNGVKTKIAVVRRKMDFTDKTSEGLEYVCILVNSKMLKGKYFEGINFQNIADVYSYIIALKVVYFPMEIFMSAYYTDVDFCIDFEITPENFALFTKEVKARILPENMHYVKSFATAENIGLQINNREQATPTKPFVKFYHKSTELLNNSKVFFDAYLQSCKSEILKGIGRMEITLKNSKFKKHYKYEIGKTFAELLSVPLEQTTAMFNAYLPNYTTKAKKAMKTNNLTPYQIRELGYIRKLVQYGESKQQIINDAIAEMPNRLAKNRAKTEIEKLFDLLASDATDGEILEANNERRAQIDNALKVVGLYE